MEIIFGMRYKKEIFEFDFLLIIFTADTDITIVAVYNKHEVTLSIKIIYK